MFGWLKRSRTGTSNPQLLTQINNTINPLNIMNDIDNSVLNHLKMTTNGALMITGDWGSGKTYYIKSALFEQIRKKTVFKPMIVSVYGAKDKESIAQKLVFSYWDTYANSVVSSQKVTQALTKLASALPIVTKYVNVEKILTANGENLLKLLPHGELVICFDDVERLSDKLDINDFLGLVNELVENSRAKVILIANAKKFRKEGESDKLIYLEKTVEKTVHYSPDLSVVIDNIFEECKEGPYKNFLKQQKNWLLETLEVAHEDDAFKSLKAELVNIRTIKFAIEHFRLVFEAVTETKQVTEELVQKQLKSTWLFVVGISVVFRSRDQQISFDNMNHLEESEPVLADLDFANGEMHFREGKEEEGLHHDPRTFAKCFKKEFYERLNEPYRFYKEIFRFITGGQTIDTHLLNADLDEQFYSHDGKVNPAQALIDRFVTGGWWRFSDIEFKPSLERLLQHSSAGEFDNPVSYLNAAVFLFGFKELLGKTDDEIVGQIKEGLDKYFARASFNEYVEAQFSMVTGHFTGEHAGQLATYMKDGFRKLEEKYHKDTSRALEQLFIYDLEQFIKETLQATNNIRIPYQPVFTFFNTDSIVEGLKVWQPTNIMDLASFIELRYQPNSFINSLFSELTFLERLKLELSKANDIEKPLSLHLIRKELLPKIEKAIALLKAVAQPAELTEGE